MKTLFLAACILADVTLGQPLNPAKLLQPPTDAWPTYNGDYTGRRYSPLKQINSSNVSTLNLAWTRRFTAGGGRGGGAVQIKATPLAVNGILYFAAPDNAWAVDARSGRELWHFEWQTKGGIHIGNRGFGMYGDWLYFETPDCYLISLDAKTGKMRWSHQIAEVKREYFCTPAPLVIKNHIITGVGGDSLDLPGYLESRDPETGALQWRWNTTPRPGEPGAETWPSKESMEHGGGMTWLSGTYDPELNLYYLGTGNPNPVYAPQSRSGDNLYTCSIVALNPDTGKLAWHYQVSPHDSHDWDNVETPVLIDGEFRGQPRKMLAQAARNGYFVLLDRTNGKNLLTAPFVEGLNWAKGLDAEGRPIPNPDMEAKPDGTLVSPTEGGAANWFAPSFSPATGLFYTNASESYGLDWKTDTSKTPEGYGGRLQDRENRVEPPLSESGRKPFWFVEHRGWITVRRRSHRQRVRDGPRQWQDPVARRIAKLGEQRTDYVRDGRAPVFGGRCRRLAVRLHAAGALGPHFLPGRQTTLGRLELRKAAAFLLDQVILDAAHALGGLEDFRPGRVAFTEQNAIGAVGLLTCGPVLTVDAANAAGIRVDPGNRVYARFHHRADVQLQREFLRRACGEHIHGAFPVDRGPFGLVIVESGTHAERLQRFAHLCHLFPESLPAGDPVDAPGARHDDVPAADDLVQLDRLGQSFGGEGRGVVVSRIAADAEVVQQFPDVFGVCRRPAEIRRVELDDFISHLCDRAHRAWKILRKCFAHREEFQPDGDPLAGGERQRTQSRHRNESSP
jgi:alcohol dehydrogenase (cytochrome c)